MTEEEPKKCGQDKYRKTGGITMWVTDEDKRAAKAVDVFPYLETADPSELVKLSQNEYCLRSHDSFKISHKDGKWLWFWYSRGVGGRSAVDYLMKVKGYRFLDAVNEVNRATGRSSAALHKAAGHRKKLRLPAKNTNNATAVRYLTGRGIDEKLINELIEGEMLFESFSHKSAVFMGFDANGKPAHAAYRATDSDAKGDYSGSDKRYAFRLEKEGADTVRVFESAIDLLSYITICRLRGMTDICENMISTAGINTAGGGGCRPPLALKAYLENHPQTERVILQLDNDEPGRAAAESIRDALQGEYTVDIMFCGEGKDYNEWLQILRKGGGK